MRVPSIAIYTLMAVSACSLASSSLAQANPTSASGTSDNYVVPIEPTTTPTPTGSGTPLAQPRPVNDLALTTLDIQVVGVTGELEEIVRNSIQTRLGGGTSQAQVQNDVAALLATGLFSDVRGTAQTTPQGMKVVYQVQPVTMQSLQLSGAKVLTPQIANEVFKSQFGQPITPTGLRQGFQQLNQWYQDNGYSLAQVAEMRPNRNGVVNIEVAEGVIGDINIRFVDKEGQPTQARTQKNFILEQLKLSSGQVFQADVARQDLQQLYRLGLFERADVSLDGDARKVDVTYELREAPARAVNAGAGYSATSGLVGTVNYSDRNVGGVNQQVSVNVQGNTRDLQFDGSFSNPYNATNPDRLGYSINAFRRQGASQTFTDEVPLANGDRAREGQLGASITLNRPVEDWQASVGLNYTRTSIRDGAGNLVAVDEQGNPLTLSPNGIDDLVTLSAGISQDRRDNPFNPTQGSVMSLTTEQSIPVGSGNILMNRVQANFSQYIPANVLGGQQPEVLAINVRGGTTIGDLPPHQAFNLGGVNSVRGYETGEVGTARSYVLASAEYRFPIFSPLGGVVFGDFASDLGTSSSVPGEPGVVRGQPGTGFGYGAGLRLNSPIGIIRADYGFNDKGESRLQLGIGQKF